MMEPFVLQLVYTALYNVYDKLPVLFLGQVFLGAL